MSNKEITPLMDALKFSGKVSASISHDIKNVLAIINENAGLLNDISLMIEEGFILSPTKLKNISTKIENQVIRANDIIYCLNKFAHSVDESIVEFDVNQVISMLSKIFERVGKSKGLLIELILYKTDIKITNNLFFFQHLVWNIFELFTKNITTDDILKIRIDLSNDLTVINFGLSKNYLKRECINKFLLEKKLLCQSINSTLNFENEERIINLQIIINNISGD